VWIWIWIIDKNNRHIWVLTMDVEARIQSSGATSAYLSLPVEHASSDETPATMRGWALDLCSWNPTWNSVSTWTGYLVFVSIKMGNCLPRTAASHQPSQACGTRFCSKVTASSENIKKSAEVMIIGITGEYYRKTYEWSRLSEYVFNPFSRWGFRLTPENSRSEAYATTHL
jgi:hypothetical protein